MHTLTACFRIHPRVLTKSSLHISIPTELNLKTVKIFGTWCVSLLAILVACSQTVLQAANIDKGTKKTLQEKVVVDVAMSITLATVKHYGLCAIGSNITELDGRFDEDISWWDAVVSPTLVQCLWILRRSFASLLRLP